MNRTYHFQVDNGLFVAEYHLGKNYEDITVEDISELGKMLDRKIVDYNKMGRPEDDKGTIANMTHPRSCMSPSRKKYLKYGCISDHIDNRLLVELGSDKRCAICGEKRVKLKSIRSETNSNRLPNTALIYGASNNNNFKNFGNNLNYSDVCPVCLSLSLFSILNTKRLGSPVLYLSDSDNLMRYYTKENDKLINKSLEMGSQSAVDMSNDIELLDDIMLDKQLFDDATYIDVYKYSLSSGSEHKNIININKKVMDLVLGLKDDGLYGNFIELGLARSVMNGYNPLNTIYKTKKKVDIELYNRLKEAYMNKDDIKLVRDIVDKIEVSNDMSKIIKELNYDNNANRGLESIFRKYLTMDSLDDIDKVLKQSYKYRSYILMELKIREGNRDE